MAKKPAHMTERQAEASVQRFKFVMLALVASIHAFLASSLLRRGCPAQGRA